MDGFLCAALEPGAVGRTVNLGTGREISIGDLAKLIAQMTGSSVAVETEDQRLRPEKSEVERLLASNALAAELLKWEPKVNLEEGLARTIEWIKANFPDRYNAGPDAILDPDDIAETYWQLHRQKRSAWTFEMDLRPWKESW